jgi:outer membrane protein assembly factor BamB
MKLRFVCASVLALAALTFALPGVALAQVIGPDGSSRGGASGLRTAAGLKTPIVPNGSWTTYHHDNAHTGADLTLSRATTVTAGWTSPTLDERVFGSPLVYGGLVYVATLNNTVYALNQTDGSVVWSNHLRNPEVGGWGCGNVAPQGILGTGVVDAGTGRIFVTTLATDDHYRLEGLNLTTGLEEVNTDISGFIGLPFDWTVQQQRGALAVANGYVYVPFGGRAGDCGNYHGWVFAVPTNGTAIAHYYVTPGIGAGFWAAGGVVVNDSTGKVFVTSGNGTGSGCNAKHWWHAGVRERRGRTALRHPHARRLVRAC